MIVLLLASAVGAYEYVIANNLQSENRTLSSEASSYSSDYSAQLSAYSANSAALVQTLISHVLNLQSVNGHFFNRTKALEDYLANATMTWSGTMTMSGTNVTGGIGDTDVGTSDIGGTLRTFFGEATSLYITIDSFNVTNVSSGTGDIRANLSFAGSTAIWGAINGTVSASYQFVHESGGWLISKEDWDFETFDVQFAQGILGL